MTELSFPVEFVMQRTPISLQSSPSSKAEWMKHVKQSAQARLNEIFEWYHLDERPVAVTILYFPEEKMQGDIDNIVKPILDGMNSVVYRDDECVERVVVQRFDPSVISAIAVDTEQIGRALELERPVVYVRIDDHLGWRRAP